MALSFGKMRKNCPLSKKSSGPKPACPEVWAMDMLLSTNAKKFEYEHKRHLKEKTEKK